MRLIDMDTLVQCAASFSDPEVFPESWESRHSFSQYRSTPRPFHALFLICTPISVCFSPENGQPIYAKKGDVVFIPKHSRYFVTVEGGRSDGIDTDKPASVNVYASTMVNHGLEAVSVAMPPSALSETRSSSV